MELLYYQIATGTLGVLLLITLALLGRTRENLKSETTYANRVGQKRNELEQMVEKLRGQVNPEAKIVVAAKQLSEKIRKAQRTFESESGVKAMKEQP